MTPTLVTRVDAIRHFNRFYTRQIGLLQEHLLHSPFSLTQARVIYEIAQGDTPTATDLAVSLGLDAGYLSRIIRDLVNQQIISKTRSTRDSRQHLLTLTPTGKQAFETLAYQSREEIGNMMSQLSDEMQQRLTQAMTTIEQILTPDKTGVSYLLRTHRPGDMGWVIAQHASYYNTAFGWGDAFEGLVAEVAAHFINNFNPKRECCWIAEREGENVGSVLLIEKSADTAQLRLLLVKPEARGLGIGKRLVQECTRFARQVGFKKIVLWTNKGLDTARAIYEKEGYQLIKEEPHTSFGLDLVGQTWELVL